MISSRTLNGINPNTSVLGFALLKQNNLSDVTNAAFARNNLGLIGTLTGGTNINLTAYNGTANCTISAFGNSNSIPNTIAGYNSAGQLDIRGVTGTGFGISNFNNSALFNEKNVFLNTTTMTINGSDSFCGIKLKNSVSTFFIDVTRTGGYGKMFLPSKAYMLWCEDAADYCYYADGNTGDFTTRGSIFSNSNINATDSIITPSINSLGQDITLNSKNLISIGNLTANNISIGGIIDTTKKLRVNGDALITGTTLASQFIAQTNISTNIIKPFDDGASIIFKNWIDMNTAFIDTIGNFTATGNIISSGFLQSSSITSTGSDISFNNKNIRNIGNITKQLWSITNSTFQSFSSLSSMLLDPLTNNPNLSFSAGVNIFTVKLSIPFTFNNEAFLRMSFYLQSMTIGTTLGLYLRISTATGLHQGVLATNSVIMTPAQIGSSINFSLSLNPLGLVNGSSYMITLLDTAGAATCTYRINTPEISLLY